MSLAGGGATRRDEVAELSFAGAETMTVRVAEPVRPCGSVTMYLIVCVPVTDVSMIGVPAVEVALSTSTVMPRFMSVAGETMVAPRSA